MATVKKTTQLLNHFSHITLDQLNASYSLMERLDRKYIVSLETLDAFLEKIQSDYHVLAIKNTKVFKYDSMYMDTLDRLMYHHHNDQAPVRMKVRTRRYVDSNICFFEIKQKDNNLTRKFRIPYPYDDYATMDHNATMFFDGVCTSMGTMKGKKLQPSLKIQYNRITLCSKTTDEKITIDTDIVFHDMHRKNSPAIVMPPMAIIEAKSAQKKPASDKVITKLGAKAMNGCSKYCLGIYYTNKRFGHDTFKKAIKTIEKLRPEEKAVEKKTVKKLGTLVKYVTTQPIEAKKPIKTSK